MKAKIETVEPVTRRFNAKHGYCAKGNPHPVWTCWNSLFARCYNPKTKGYHLYGGRGIKVCHRWKVFKNFLQDMGPGWKRGLTLDRINNNRGYNPENCRWATHFQQMGNKRTNVRITALGKTMHLAAWARHSGLLYQTIKQRIFVYGWHPDRAVTQPSRQFKRPLRASLACLQRD